MHKHKGRGICQVAIHVAIFGSELRRIVLRRSSENLPSTHSGEYAFE
jgi:hypothetical protein